MLSVWFSRAACAPKPSPARPARRTRSLARIRPADGLRNGLPSASACSLWTPRSAPCTAQAALPSGTQPAPPSVSLWMASIPERAFFIARSLSGGPEPVTRPQTRSPSNPASIPQESRLPRSQSSSEGSSANSSFALLCQRVRTAVVVCVRGASGGCWPANMWTRSRASVERTTDYGSAVTVRRLPRVGRSPGGRSAIPPEARARAPSDGTGRRTDPCPFRPASSLLLPRRGPCGPSAGTFQHPDPSRRAC